VSVSVSPTSASLVPTVGTQAFQATVTGTADTTVTWSVQEGLSGGSVSAGGLYTAPSGTGTFHVVAKSNADTTKTASATVTVASGVSVVVTPSGGSLETGGTLLFACTVTGSQDTACNWSVQEGASGGTISPSGLYTAPAGAGSFHVVATSHADPTRTVTVNVIVSAPGTPSLVPPDRATVWNPGLNSVGGIPSGSWPIYKTISPSGGNDRTAIQAALDSCPPNQVVKLASGTFHISGTLSIPSNVVLRGSGGVNSGAAQTKILSSSPHTFTLVTIDPGVDGFTQITDLATDAVKGAYSVTLKTARSLAVGEIVMIDQMNDPAVTWWGDQDQGPGSDNRGWFNRGPNSQGEPEGRPTGQMMEVASVSGTTVTFNTPFHMTFSVGLKAQLCRLSSNATGTGPVQAAARNAGVEDLYLQDGGGGDGGASVRLGYAAYSWIRNVEAQGSNGSSVAITGSFRCVMRDSFIHTTDDPNPGGGGYGLSVNWHSADNLVENNIHWNFNKVMVMRASGGGNVIGYNYMEDGWISYAPTFVECGLNASHSTTPMYELFEGNQSFNFDGDSTHGNSVYITVFRNHLTGLRRAIGPLATYVTGGLFYEDSQNRRAVGLMTAHRYYTFIGNVLGSQGQVIIAPKSPVAPNGPFVYGDPPIAPWSREEVAMWEFGYNNQSWSPTPDATVAATAIRDGNFDYFTGTVKWDRAAQPLPDSLYLTGKPAFFGSSTWPWVDPNGGTKTYSLPARVLFDSMPH
jgi:hypothetical protein